VLFEALQQAYRLVEASEPDQAADAVLALHKLLAAYAYPATYPSIGDFIAETNEYVSGVRDWQAITFHCLEGGAVVRAAPGYEDGRPVEGGSKKSGPILD
jgi:hypothetical protein